MSINECASHKRAKWIVANAAPHQINYSFDSHVLPHSSILGAVSVTRRVFSAHHHYTFTVPALASIIFPVDVWIYLAGTRRLGGERTCNLLNLNLIFTLMESISLKRWRVRLWCRRQVSPNGELGFFLGFSIWNMHFPAQPPNEKKANHIDRYVLTAAWRCNTSFRMRAAGKIPKSH